VDHGWHEVALLVVENVPLAHAPHARSCVAVPGSAAYWPARQVVRGTHAVDASPSWSQVPAPQGTACAAPPAQKFPGWHVPQSAAVVLVAGARCTVPAGQAPAARHTVWFSPLV
jgi:hypothetical protein